MLCISVTEQLHSELKTIIEYHQYSEQLSNITRWSLIYWGIYKTEISGGSKISQREQ